MTGRLRAGYVVDRLLIFGTGGLAAATGELNSAGIKSSNTSVGWVLGAGIDYKLTDFISIRGEVLHYGLGKASFSANGGSVAIGTETNVFRTGLSYHF